MSTSENTQGTEEGVNRRDFLHVATVGVSGVAAVGAIWPFVHQMNPAADTLALGSIEVDLSSVGEGESIVIKFRGKPVFVRHRTKAEIEQALADDAAILADPQGDAERVLAGKEQWLIVQGLCTHLGCVPLGSRSGDDKGEFGGWFCPCHGSHYDTSGRIRKGPAPRNLDVMEYTFLSDTLIKIG